MNIKVADMEAPSGKLTVQKEPGGNDMRIIGIGDVSEFDLPYTVADVVVTTIYSCATLTRGANPVDSATPIWFVELSCPIVTATPP